MAIIPAAASPQAALRATVTESIEDPVSAERMTQAVTVVPCGHIFNRLLSKFNAPNSKL